MSYYLSKKKQIRNLLIVFLGGIGFAVLFALMGLYHYSPSGKYYAKNTLLAPEVLSQIAIKDSSSKTRFIYNKIEFSYYEPSEKIVKKISVPEERYKQFYDMVANEESLSNVSDEISSFFNYFPSSLTLTLRPENQPNDPEKIYQQVNFVNHGDFFRIVLNDQNAGTNWVYFYHPNIYQKVLSLFNSSL